MSADDLRSRPVPEPKPRSALRHWSTYRSTGEYYEDYRGYVPLPALVAIDRLVRDRGLTFPEAYRTLLDRGAIVHLWEVPPPDDAP
jgi:hypothetical protein